MPLFDEFRHMEPVREVFYRDWETHGVQGQPEAICWHYTVGNDAASLHTLRGGTERDVSSHFVILANGEIVQVLNTDDASWCQGVRVGNELDHWVNQKVKPWKSAVPWANENLLCVSVEVVNAGWSWDGGPRDPALPESYQPYASDQIDAAIRLRDRLCSTYGIPIDNAHQIGHEQLDRAKADPGPQWPWDVIAEPAGAGIDWRAEYSREHTDRMAQAVDLGDAIRSLNRAVIYRPADRELRTRLNASYAGKV
jgi:N-acetyl-anhydromuramyl-L-alanine amidase AmpD